MELINNRMYMSVKEAAAQTGATIPTVYGWLQRYELPRIRVVGNLMIAQDDLTAFLQRKPITGRPRKKRKTNNTQPATVVPSSPTSTQNEEHDDGVSIQIRKT